MKCTVSGEAALMPRVAARLPVMTQKTECETPTDRQMNKKQTDKQAAKKNSDKKNIHRGITAHIEKKKKLDKLDRH